MLPEKAAYFEKEIFEPRESSKLTYPQLRDYIDYLRRSGYTATQLEVELYKNEAGEWIAIAVEHDVTAKGRTENEALSLLMDALAAHFKKS